MIDIEVVYAQPQRAIVKAYRLAPGSLVGDALRLAAVEPELSAVDWESASFGIFGRVIDKQQPLRQGDRLEIYRPLAADPKVARRARAKEIARKARLSGANQ